MPLQTHKVISCLLLCSTLAFGQVYNTEVEAKINLLDNSEFVQIEGSAINKTQLPFSLRYILSLIDNSGENPDKKDYSGRFILGPGEQKNLDTQTFPTKNQGKLTILLLIYNLEDQLIGMDRVVLNGDESDEVKRIVVNDNAIFSRKKDGGVSIRGITVEDTKTKFGRDFYRYFADEYRANTVNGLHPVTVKETFAIANTSKIELIINNNKLLEFILPPKDDVIRSYAAESVRMVSKYFRDQELNANQKIRY
ncbi:hypothetical protein BST85_02015 [Aureitalea marina]|uniref:Curli production assembly/transport component CsgE n=1 Tax=Aureitalea marina TaxID=930804 RepID=A0A2S7KMI4_9FLAO|nr:hypothetical protein BST85_02015 [Aureitalea marina]